MNRVTLHASRYVVGALLLAAIVRLLTGRAARAPEPGNRPPGPSGPGRSGPPEPGQVGPRRPS